MGDMDVSVTGELSHQRHENGHKTIQIQIKQLVEDNLELIGHVTIKLDENDLCIYTEINDVQDQGQSVTTYDSNESEAKHLPFF